MRFVFGFLSGLLGALAGWFGLAFLVVSLSGPDRDGGLAMGAFFNIGPIGGLAGFIAGVWLFSKFGVTRETTPLPGAEGSGETPQIRTRLSRPFAAVLVVIVGGLAWWAWYELIRSPYLTHGFMTLSLQFRLPSGMALPQNKEDVQIEVTEGQSHAEVWLSNSWHGHDGDRQVILATVDLTYKTSNREVSLTLPGAPQASWRLNLSSDPDPTPGYSAWRLPNSPSIAQIEMNFRLTASH
jgi:MFS family permease